MYNMALIAVVEAQMKSNDKKKQSKDGKTDIASEKKREGLWDRLRNKNQQQAKESKREKIKKS
jgi:hypothetical protein